MRLFVSDIRFDPPDYHDLQVEIVREALGLVARSLGQAQGQISLDEVVVDMPYDLALVASGELSREQVAWTLADRIHQQLTGITLVVPRGASAEEQALEAELEGLNAELAWEIAETTADVAGLVDPTPVSDLAGAGFAVRRGDPIGVGLSLLSVVPYLGDSIAKPLKGGRAAARLARLQGRIRQLLERLHMLKKQRVDDVLSEHLSRVEKLLDTPLSRQFRRSMRGRWRAISGRATRLRERISGLPVEDARWERLDDARKRIDAERMGHSGTVRGSHGARAGTDGASLATRNWNRANDQVRTWAQSGEPVTVGKIKELNRLLGEGLEHNAGLPGAVRAAGEEVSAGGSLLKMYVPGADVDMALGRFERWLAEADAAGMNPVEKAAGAYQRLVSIHPFWDGNGRTSRMIMDWILMRDGLPPAVLHDPNVAVFVGQQIRKDIGSNPQHAVEEVTRGVQRSLDLLEDALDGGT